MKDVTHLIRCVLDLPYEKYPTLESLEPFAEALSKHNPRINRLRNIGDRKIKLMESWLSSHGLSFPIEHKQSVVNAIALLESLGYTVTPPKTE